MNKKEKVLELDRRFKPQILAKQSERDTSYGYPAPRAIHCIFVKKTAAGRTIRSNFALTSSILCYEQTSRGYFKSIFIINLDLKKCFDTILHSVIIEELRKNGMFVKITRQLKLIY